MTITLTLKKKWFDMILSGEKKEEYREVTNYWINRLCWHEYHHKVTKTDLIYGQAITDFYRRNIDAIKFTNGYGHKVPYLKIELKSIHVGNGNEAWGFENSCFILCLGNILETGNLKS